MNPTVQRSLVLASLSPRRHELLRAAGVEFTVVGAAIEERARPAEAPVEMVRRLAQAKAREVASRVAESWVLAADTVVILGAEVLGKPKGEMQAREMIGRLSGREHEVATAFVLLGRDQGVEHAQVVSTRVIFRRLSQGEISKYARSNEPLDKAGAYAVQGRGGHLVASIHGSYTNVIGLPLEAVLEVLAAFGLYSPYAG